MEIYPEETERIEGFRQKVENYFKGKGEIIDKVIACQVEHYVSRVKLVCIVPKINWLGYFNDPPRCYSDLTGVRTVRHACENLSDCDKAPT